MPLTIKIFKSAFAAFLVFIAARLLLYHYSLVVFPYPSMLREGALMTSTQALLHGLNPFSFGLQPQYTNTYGIVYTLIVWPLAAAFGDTIFIHRMVVALFILGSCGVVFLAMARMGIALLLNISACLMFYASLLYPGTSTPCIDAGAPGVFFLLLTVFIPWSKGYSWTSLAISAFLGIIAFYTKQYTALGILITGSYVLFFVSKRKAFFYGLLFLTLGFVSVLVVNALMPAYFNNCLFVPVNMAHSWSTMERLYLQINMYSRIHQWVLLLLGILLLWHGLKAFRRRSFNWRLAFKQALSGGFMLAIWGTLWASFVLYASLGRHNGATLWYFFQLLSPFFLIASAWIFSRQTLWPLIGIPLLAITLYTMTIGHDYRRFNQHQENWPDLVSLMKQHRNILNSALLVPVLIEQNKQFYDNGLSEYFLYGGQRNSWLKYVAKEDPRVFIQHLMFFADIRKKIEAKAFDMIVIQPNLLPMGVDQDIRKNYRYEGGFSVFAPQDNRPYQLTIWFPNAA